MNALRAAAWFILCAALNGCGTEYQVNYGLNHFAMGLYGQATPALVSAANSLEGVEPPDSRLPRVYLALGEIATSTRQYDRALDYFRKSAKAAVALTPPDEINLRFALNREGVLFLDQAKFAEAVAPLERALAISARRADVSGLIHAIDLDNLGLAYAGVGRKEEGIALSRKALEKLKEVSHLNGAAKAEGVVLYNIGYGLAESERYAEAEQHYRKALEILAPADRPPLGETWRIRTVVSSYAALLRKQGREQEAATLEARIK